MDYSDHLFLLYSLFSPSANVTSNFEFLIKRHVKLYSFNLYQRSLFFKSLACLSVYWLSKYTFFTAQTFITRTIFLFPFFLSAALQRPSTCGVRPKGGLHHVQCCRAAFFHHPLFVRKALEFNHKPMPLFVRSFNLIIF